MSASTADLRCFSCWADCAQGWNVLGNLLDLGKVAFAPSSPAVLRLVDNLLSSHELMAKYVLVTLQPFQWYWSSFAA